MKKSMIKVKFYAVLLLCTLTSCNKFLEVEPVGRTTIPVLFSDMDGIRAAMAGAYSTTYAYYSSHFYLYPEIASDELLLNLSSASETQRDVYNFNASADDETGMVGKIWEEIYVALSNINNILFYLPNLEVKFPQYKQELQTYRAEALFLRALCHFDLCRVYAQPYNYTADASHLGVPILQQTPGPDDNVSRKSVKEVYDFIINDLLAAKQLYTAGGNDLHQGSNKRFYVSNEAVQALLSRVYLYKGDWDNCIQSASAVIAAIPLARGDDYTHMFFTLNDAGKETIFRLNGLDKSSALLDFYNFKGESGKLVKPAGQPTDTLLKLFFDPTDIRFSILMQRLNDQGSETDGSAFVTRKFDADQTAVDADRQHYNPLVLRVSELYLNRAEAYWNKGQFGEAVADIKQLEARAFNTSVDDITVTSNKDLLNHVIAAERMKELAFEGHRFFDITRRKEDLQRDATTTSTVPFISYPNDRFVLPISQKELDANLNMIGNPTVNN
ncbi:RagB/SusD family nutrient uptake outer membrane protein [Olivibacter ginsenosidimutans]|uniref:RagB/SusD family nutrient uptake outer membrane protein n=2 Tax=Olivibacter ginsenosidimutans TaxID=1176537 RepID=A0ABP9BPU5_9SPHI